MEVLINLQKINSKGLDRKREKARAAGDLDNRLMVRTPLKYFRFGSKDHPIAKCPKQPKENEKQQKQVRFNEKGNCACNNGENNSDQNIYVPMARIFSDDECHSRNFGDN